MREFVKETGVRSVRERIAEQREKRRLAPRRPAASSASTVQTNMRADLEACERRIRELEHALMHALHQMHRDPLTGLLNRRGLDRAYAQCVDQQRAVGDAMCCVYLDLDDFKSINDRFGHAAGDACLQHLAHVLVRTLRRDDVIARVGGDEFVVLLPHLAAGEAAALVERVREAMVQAPLPWTKEPRAVRFCAGMTNVIAGEAYDDVLARADRCLMHAKAGSKNKTLLSPLDHETPPASHARHEHHECHGLTAPHATDPRRIAPQSRH